MAQKIVEVKSVGPVIVARRKGAKHIRLSVDSRGRARLSLPYYIPISVGLTFVYNKKKWLKKQQTKHTNFLPADGMVVGKKTVLRIKTDTKNIRMRTKTVGNKLIVYNFQPNPESEQLVEKAVIRCLKKEASDLLIPRLSGLAKKHGYKYKVASIKVLRSRWGSCSNAKNIALSAFLIQLPWRLIDYVLIHELAHTKHLSHDPVFWEEVGLKLPDYRTRRTELKNYRPAIMTHHT